MFRELEPEVVRVFGDWHSNTDYALHMINGAARDNITVMLHTGDFGLWSGSSYVEKLEEALSRSGAILAFVDGNHEDYRLLRSLSYDDDDGLGVVSPRIRHIPRGYRWVWGGKKFLGVGGAVSIDRDYRVNGETYFPEEMITEDNAIEAKRNGKTDVMITHDAPFLPVPFHSFGESLDYDGALNRFRVRSIMETVKPSILIHGHYHSPHVSTVGGTKVFGVDCDMAPPSNNYVDISIKDI